MFREWLRAGVALAVFTPAIAGAVTITSTQRLTNLPSDQYDPIISGHYVTYTDNRNGNADIYMLDLNTMIETNLTNDPAYQILEDMQGDFVVWADYRSGDGNVWVYHIPSGTACQLTYNTADQIYPSIRDSLIAFQDDRSGDWDIWDFDLSVLDPNNFAQSCQQLAAGQISGEAPLWVASGVQEQPKTSGRYVVWTDDNTSRVFGYDRQLNTEFEMPDHGIAQSLPRIDGSEVVYIEDDGSGTNRQVVYYNIATNTFVQITQDQYRHNYPDISGNYIAWEDDRAGNLDIYLYDMTTGEVTPLTTDTADQYMNDIDGTNVVFTDTSQGNLDVMLVTFAPDPPPDPCANPGPSTPIANIAGQTVLALDDASWISERDFTVWPFVWNTETGGNATWVSDHSRIDYNLQLAADAPEALVTMHVKLSKSSLPEFEQALGSDSHGGIVINVNGTERTWVDTNTGPRTVTLTALRDDDWQTHFDAQQSFDVPFAFKVPGTFFGIETDGGTATLTADATTCTYKNSQWQFKLQSCSGGQNAGDAVSGSTITLALQSGTGHLHAAAATITINGTGSVGDDQWTDISFPDPVPLFKGNNTISISGPDFGHTYDVYRRIDFASGGTIAFATAPICQPNQDLLSQCDASGADVLFGPVTYVRAEGPPQTQTENFAATDAGGIVCLQNGDGNGRMKASAATVSFNSTILFDQDNLQPQTNELAEAVAVEQANTLVTTLNSAPGTMVTLKVVRDKSAPQTPTLVLRGCSATKVADEHQHSLFFPLCAFGFAFYFWRRSLRHR